MSDTVAGLLALIFIVVLTGLAFTKAVPFEDHFEVSAVFETSNNLRPGSPVRVAGVDVGEVRGVEEVREGEEASVVIMRIHKEGRPLRQDAEMAIRPRIFLEGNFFVDVTPGTPSAPELEDGDTIPIQQTSTPVQFDQILAALQSDTREDLKVLLREYSSALEGDGARGFNRSIRWWKPAYRDSALVNEAMLGENEGDLSGYIDKAGQVAEALDRDPEALKSLITDFNRTAAAFARVDQRLEASLRELPRMLRAARPAMDALNRAFPPLRRLAADLRPGVRSSGPTIDDSMPFIRQARRLVSEPEARGLSRDLRRVVPDLARLTRASLPLYDEVRLASSCQNEVILPWSQETVPDDKFPAKGPVYQEAVKYLPGLAGESRSGDANGQWFRVLGAGGLFTYTLGSGEFGTTAMPLMGTNPPKPRSRPPIRPDVPCETQERPDLRSRPGAPPERVATDLDAPGALERLARARETAIDWLRDSITREGLEDQLRVLDEDATPDMLPGIREARDGLGGAAP
jgi:phospholipid/cholesterol/gamma-HCH transport system substrate-binding protein